MSTAPIVFSATGTVQTHQVETTGTYVVEAAGGQGGAGAAPGVKGARVTGMFYLKKFDLLKIVVGRQGAPAAPPPQPRGGRGGSSLVWTGAANLPQPIKLMLSARGGSDGEPANPDGAVDAAALGMDVGGTDPLTANTLATQWTRGLGAAPASATGTAARVDRHGCYNAGAFPGSMPGFQAGDGYVSIAPVAVSNPPFPPDKRASPASTSAGAEPTEPAPAAKPAGVDDRGGGEAPSSSILPQVTPRPGSWAKFLRPRTPPKTP